RIRYGVPVEVVRSGNPQSPSKTVLDETLPMGVSAERSNDFGSAIMPEKCDRRRSPPSAVMRRIVAGNSEYVKHFRARARLANPKIKEGRPTVGSAFVNVIDQLSEQLNRRINGRFFAAFFVGLLVFAFADFEVPEAGG